MEERLESFRFAFLPTFLLTLALGGLAWLLWLLIFYLWKIKTTGLPIGLGGAALAALVLTFLVVLFFPVSVGASGLQSFDAWGRYHRVAWTDITAAQPCRVVGLKYLRVQHGTAGRTVWVPLFLADMDRFRSLVLQHGGPANLLTQALQVPAKR